jgi:hypothetical protein
LSGFQLKIDDRNFQNSKRIVVQFKTEPVIFWESVTSTELVRSVSKAVTDPDPKSEMRNLISSLRSFQTINNAAAEEIQRKRADEDQDENPKLRPATCWTERLVSDFEGAYKVIL